MLGKIHSIETLGLNDGPGIRFVVFFQGCKLRCAYCHNPDTWNMSEGKDMSPEELLQKALRFKQYFEKSSGGITCSGGDPLLQPEFLIEFLKLCKEHGLHTAVDTAGFGLGSYEKILNYTDLVILDVKHVNRSGYRNLVGGDIEEFRKFAEVLKKSNTSLWIRHVVVPGITDGESHMNELKALISEFNNIEKVELLPYHTLGVNKYETMGIPYRLQGIKPMCREKIRKMEERFISV